MGKKRELRARLRERERTFASTDERAKARGGRGACKSKQGPSRCRPDVHHGEIGKGGTVSRDSKPPHQCATASKASTRAAVVPRLCLGCERQEPPCHHL